MSSPSTPPSSGMRPFVQRPRRPMVGDPLSPAQVARVREICREELSAFLNVALTAPPAGEPVFGLMEQTTGPAAGPLPEIPAGEPVTEAAISPAPGTDPDDDVADPPSPATDPVEPPSVVPAEAPVASGPETAVLTAADVPGATPAMLALINDAPQEKRGDLIKIAQQETPAAVRLAQMRKAATNDR